MKILLKIIATVVLVVAAYVLYLSHAAGEFRTVVNTYPGECRAIPGLPGSEDITIHPNGTIAYISSDDRRSRSDGNPLPGAIYRYDLEGPLRIPVNLTPDADIEFRPHGISLYVDQSGRETLFVVNHPATGSGAVRHTVEIFDVVAGELQHRETVTSPMLISPNDILGVDHERFYVTNDQGSEPGWRQQVEAYLRLPWSNVVYFDGNAFQEAAARLSFANGINMSPDGLWVYVAEVSHGRVQEYSRDIASGALTHQRTLSLGFGVDNIEVDPDSGDLWIGGHVKLLTFVRHAADTNVLAPSQVSRVQFNGSDYTRDPAVSTIFMDDGELLSGSSVGAWHSGRLLIGSVFEPHILDCR